MPDPSRPRWHRPARVGAAVGAVGLGAAAVALGWGPEARAGVVAGTCLALWLLELVPVWVPTVVLWTATPLLLGPADGVGPAAALGWSADPVLALFLGGFALAAAARRAGADRLVVGRALRLARGDGFRLVALAAGATAFLSMWVSNVAAAALMLAALEPILRAAPAGAPLRPALLAAVALAADVGGIATPIGSGPNGIAMAAVRDAAPISFLGWMSFGVPLAAGLVAVVLLLVRARFRPLGAVALPDGAGGADGAGAPAGPGLRRLAVVFAATVGLWLTEPLHGLPAWTVALGAAGALVALGLLGPRDAARIDWGTLVLIAGGVGLGGLLGHSGLLDRAVEVLPLAGLAPGLRLFVLCLAAALLAAVMSNTGTATLLVPLALGFDPAPSTAVLVAVACSLGVPFVVSTPPNALAVGTGGLRGADLLGPGLVILLGGCLLIALTGRAVLRLAGIP